ncbi:CHAP domain-containing protein [Saccharopolyspora cebuensis]|uniref:CHAP domain-containing protein n=1 Tax=Saccharopolyspora cebuensis TaxID=418759 RepID=A0ABV4CP24_9PSEU
MDVQGLADRFAGELKAHQGKLEGKQNEARTAQEALESAAKAIQDQRDAQRKAADTLLAHWDSEATPGFEKKVARFDADLDATAEASLRGARIVAEVSKALDGRHSAVGNLIDDFAGKAGQFIQAGLALAGVAAPAGLMKAIAGISDLAQSYLKESGGQLKDARDEMEEAARKLRALLREVDTDGIADPKQPGDGKPDREGQGGGKGPGGKGPDGGGDGGGGDGGEQDGAGSGTAEEILDNARQHLGFQEGPNNQNKWGPTGQPWCSYFATSMWREAGVDIDKLGFTGDVYKWGQEQGTAYGQGDIAEQAKPGDALLFGTGPSYGNSTHIGIVEKVEGNTITTIEGNSGDQVRRRTYTFPQDAGEFYGGVHPK